VCLIGYLVVAYVLLPLYYRMQLTSIYSYLRERFGMTSYRTGASFFILSRTAGASARIYLVLHVLQVFVLDQWGVPFVVTVSVILAMIVLYTFQGGVKTIVWTDTLQTTCMICALLMTIYFISTQLHIPLSGIWTALSDNGYTHIINTDWRSTAFLPKQLLSGIFITVAMTGLDQEMMQKNISCRSLGESQKNMLTFSLIMAAVNVLFLILGGMLYMYMTAQHIPLPDKPDQVFPTIALHYLGGTAALVFVIGLVSALFPSADGAMTALTSSFCIDILALRERGMTEQRQTRIRKQVHISVAVVLLLCILILQAINTGSVITLVLKVAGYTYGPLVALFFLGLYTRVKLKERYVPIVCIAAPILTYIIELYSPQLFGGYQVGFESAFINVGITLAGLLIIKREKL
jgi:Na+/proline symporter